MQSCAKPLPPPVSTTCQFPSALRVVVTLNPNVPTGVLARDHPLVPVLRNLAIQLRFRDFRRGDSHPLVPVLRNLAIQLRFRDFRG